MLSDELDGERAQHAEIVQRRASSLLRTVDAASDARKVINQDIIRRPIDVARLLKEEIAVVENSFTGTIETHIPDSEFVLADTPLRQGIHHLITNAIEHNDSDEPYLGVRVTDSTDRQGWVSIEIEDNGPGIPTEEIKVLTAGEETALNHGSGLGLWVVNWVVTRYGGCLEFETPTEGGSLVRVKLPKGDEK
jgi:signal transduction histidine kinase